MRRVLEWNGRDLPPLLRELPPGRYRLDDDAECSDDEQDALRKLAARSADLRGCDY
jgi:hypothetical protein